MSGKRIREMSEEMQEKFTSAANDLIKANCLQQHVRIEAEHISNRAPVRNLRDSRIVTIGCGRQVGKTHFMIQHISSWANPDNAEFIDYMDTQFQVVPWGPALIIVQNRHLKKQIESKWDQIGYPKARENTHIATVEEEDDLHGIDVGPWPVGSVWIDDAGHFDSDTMNAIESMIASMMPFDRPRMLIKLV